MGIDEITCKMYDDIQKSGDTSILGENHLKLWDELETEIINIIGISTEYKEWMECMRKAIIYLDKYTNEGDLSAINIYNAYKVDADHIHAEMMEEQEKNNDRLKYSIVSKYMGYKIDKNTMPVLEFYSHMALMKQESEQIKSLR